MTVQCASRASNSSNRLGLCALQVAAAVFIDESGLAIATLMLICLAQLAVLAVLPPFAEPGLTAVNWFIFGSLLAALLTMAGLFWTSWRGKDSNSYDCLEPTALPDDDPVYELTFGLHWLLAAAAVTVAPAALRWCLITVSYVIRQSIGRRCIQAYRDRQIRKARAEAVQAHAEKIGRPIR